MHISDNVKELIQKTVIEEFLKETHIEVAASADEANKIVGELIFNDETIMIVYLQQTPEEEEII